VLGTEEQARQELALRAEALSQQLAACGLSTHRLNNVELAQLAFACLTPERALAHPLSERTLAGVARPVMVKRRSRKERPKTATQQEYEPPGQIGGQTVTESSAIPFSP
jgi:hypothetical protein